ncbi:hypothetical protein GCM10011392_01410 [Wenxinia marina]|nr:hypothetical protein GCM10011392_01410 [Wenxinia marina]
MVAFAVLGSCGGGTASGEIGQACMAGGRSAANPRLCGCIQSVANQTLSRADQRRAARFFDDPDEAQETRTRDDSATEAFWRRYRDFANRAESACS